MDNKEFDDIIKKKLESLNSMGSDDAWNLFKEKWNNESIIESSEENLSTEDQDLDDKIKKDLRDLRIPFNSKHWIILKEQLELEALFKKKLFVAKSVELVILAFLVVGILNLWPIQKDIHQIQFYDTPLVATISVDKETAEKHQANEQQKLEQQKALRNYVYDSGKKITRSVIPVVNLLVSKNKNISKGTAVSSEYKLIDFKAFDKKSIRSDWKELFPFMNSSLRKSSVNNAKNGPNSGRSTIIAQHLPVDQNLIAIPKRPTGLPDLDLKNKKSQKENTYVSFAIGPKVTLINSPFDPVYEFDPYNTINTNFNVSAKIHKEVGPIELYAGLGYTNTSYAPRLVKETYEPRQRQFNVASLENIKFKTFNVPLGVRVNVLESNNYSLYALAGMEFNIIADSEFIIQDSPVGNPFGPAPASKNSVNENTLLSQKEFNQGILSGGSLKENLFASASVGFGLNMNMSSKAGIFIEPRYSHFISSKGIGPNEDKFHGLSIDLGVKYLLN